MKLRLLLTRALFLLADPPTVQAQVTIDVSKITCEQFVMEQLTWTENDVVQWLNGYYNGKRNNTIVEPEAVKKNEEKVNQYCLATRPSWMPSRTCSVSTKEVHRGSTCQLI